MVDNGVVLKRIRERYEVLTATERRIADHVLSNPGSALHLSISDLAHAAGARSEASVVKFYRKLGFQGYHDFKIQLAQDVAHGRIVAGYEEVRINESIHSITEKVFRLAAGALQDTLEDLALEALEQAVELLDSCRHLHVAGFAVSNALALDAYFKFTALGLTCVHTADSHLMAISAAHMEPGDCLLAISASGESTDVIEYGREARNRRARVIALTAVSTSTLAKVADVALVTSTRELNYQTDVLSTRVAQLALLDALFLALAVKRGDERLTSLARSRKALSRLKS